MTTKKPYDGLYFLPNPDDPSGFIIDYFTLKGEEYKNQKKVDARPYGDCYHVLLIEKDKNGMPKLDEPFEAILYDPDTYIDNFLGTDVYGCILRKTDKSGKWVKDYLKKCKDNVKLQKLYRLAKSIAENELKENEDA